MHDAISPSDSLSAGAAILVVDDTPASLGLLRRTLSLHGYQTFVAKSGEDALNIARRVQPDLILLDIVMPDMDGLETCRQLKAHPATTGIPIIFMSARSETEDVVSGLDEGAVDYISKPLRMAEVCARVRTHLRIRNHQETQQEQTARLRSVLDSMAQGLMIIEADGRIEYANPACHSFLGYAPQQLAGQPLATLLGEPVALDYINYFNCHLADPGGTRRLGARDVAIRHHNGTLCPMDLTLPPMHVQEHLFVAVLHDISHHKQNETALERAAMADPLTRIANRRHFDAFIEQRWQRALRSGEQLALVVLDVDHFKLYNDSLGHPAGDSALRQIGAVLDAHAKGPTDLAARYGGEEFVLLFAGTRSGQALRIAETIRAAIETLRLPNPGSPTSTWLTASLGVATIVPTQLDDIARFFIAADRAMYEAKDAGRNQVIMVDAGNATWEAVKALMMR